MCPLPGSGCRGKERVLNRLFGRLDGGEEQGRDGVIGQQFHVARESFVSVSIRTCGTVENAMASSPLLFEAALPDYATPDRTTTVRARSFTGNSGSAPGQSC